MTTTPSTLTHIWFHFRTYNRTKIYWFHVPRLEIGRGLEVRLVRTLVYFQIGEVYPSFWSHVRNFPTFEGHTDNVNHRGLWDLWEGRLLLKYLNETFVPDYPTFGLLDVGFGSQQWTIDILDFVQ